MSTRWGIAWLLSGALVAALLPAVANAIAPDPSGSVRTVIIQPVVARNAPFAAWYDAADIDRDSMLQLRICSAHGACLHSARVAPGAPWGLGLVTARRDLRPGDYRVDLLILDRNAMGVWRTTGAYRQWVRHE